MASLTRICKKRLIGDLKMIKKDPIEGIDALPDEKDILTWYFLLKGPEDSHYKGGWYLGKIMHSPEYPFKPPDFMMLTPNGRFLTDRKICLSNTGYHSNEWSAMWNIKSIVLGFLSIMLDDREHGISHIKASAEERKTLAEQSVGFNKQFYKNIVKRFSNLIDENGNPIVKDEETIEVQKKKTTKKKTIKKELEDEKVVVKKRKTKRTTTKKKTTKKDNGDNVTKKPTRKRV